jgi:hypothetical protein
MKGIIRLKRVAVMLGVGAVVIGGAVLGTGQANAATLGSDAGGVTLSPASGSTTGTITYNAVACPTGFQGSGLLRLVDPVDNHIVGNLAPINNSVASAFTGTLNSGILGTLASTDVNVQGHAAEIVVLCTSAASGQGTTQYFQDTFVTISADGTTYTTGSSAPQSVTVALNASPSPATSGQSVTLTATVTPSAATGTIQFENNGTNINGPATISGGTATTSTTFSGITAATTETLTAVYTPTGNFTAGSPGSFSLTVNPPSANSGTIPLAVSVPQAGSFTLTVDSTDVVTLTASGLSATGATTPITVADTRNSYPGWSVSGQDAAWTGTGTAAGGTFSGNQLGWAPTDTALAPSVTLGSPVTAATPGLGTAAPLASVHAGLGNGYGTSTLGANLTLAIPATAPAGPYTSGLTISAVTTNP